MPINKLRRMLSDAGIPYEDRKEVMPLFIQEKINCKGFPDNYLLNQVIYGRKTENSWKIDAIYNYGSYGRYEGLLELWGDLIPGDPITATPEEAFKMIKADYIKTKQEGVATNGND